MKRHASFFRLQFTQFRQHRLQVSSSLEEVAFIAAVFVENRDCQALGHRLELLAHLPNE